MHKTYDDRVCISPNTNIKIINVMTLALVWQSYDKLMTGFSLCFYSIVERITFHNTIVMAIYFTITPFSHSQ